MPRLPLNTADWAGLGCRINGVSMDLAAYKAAVRDTRAKYELSVQRNEELLASYDVNVGGWIGSVAHISDFALKERQSGLEKKESTVTLATVKAVRGQRVLAELMEVHSSA